MITFLLLYFLALTVFNVGLARFMKWHHDRPGRVEGITLARAVVRMRGKR